VPLLGRAPATAAVSRNKRRCRSSAVRAASTLNGSHASTQPRRHPSSVFQRHTAGESHLAPPRGIVPHDAHGPTTLHAHTRWRRACGGATRPVRPWCCRVESKCGRRGTLRGRVVVPWMEHHGGPGAERTTASAPAAPYVAGRQVPQEVAKWRRLRHARHTDCRVPRKRRVDGREPAPSCGRTALVLQAGGVHARTEPHHLGWPEATQGGRHAGATVGPCRP